MLQFAVSVDAGRDGLDDFLKQRRVFRKAFDLVLFFLGNLDFLEFLFLFLLMFHRYKKLVLVQT